MRLESRKYLYDIEEAATLASQFTRGKSFQDYRNDAMLRLAVERAFSIIGEALVQLARIDPPSAGRITDHQRIIAFRNILVHAYAHVDNRLVWEIVEYKLPGLMNEVSELMNDPDEPS
ncbi:MAG TPA: HepT-like ribonuclease domain-containing protein [Acidobacteriaceae bacterium]|nr:HepT-like ribonuclease domain-containing protein [Acidobacteriaceae bacterium]